MDAPEAIRLTEILAGIMEKAERDYPALTEMRIYIEALRFLARYAYDNRPRGHGEG